MGPSIFSGLFMPAKVRVIVGTPDYWGLQFSKASSTKLDASVVLESGAAVESRTVTEDRSLGEPATEPEPANLQREQRDRSISNLWIHRVMLAALRNSGRTDEAIALAGKKWLEE
ncbi:MAG: hypothetical protein FJ308_17635 [Planctomycetes bacterium]|nr:hypothetical protein [Planctomycetota bacterium]